MDTIKLFRRLVIAEAVLVAVSIAQVFVIESGRVLPEAVTDYLNGPGAGPLQKWMDGDELEPAIWLGASAIAFVIVYAASLVGLFKFKPWARIVYIAITVLGLAMYPFIGSSLTTPAEDIVADISMAVSGAVLVLLFVSPVRERFAAGARSPDAGP